LQNPSSLIWLVLIAVSIPTTYLIVRRTQVQVLFPAIVGSFVDSLIFGLFSLSVHDSPAQALVAGLVSGILFNTLTVTAAAYFRQNNPVRQ